MASEFQLGARLLLPAQEDILPCITALYLTSSAESESESDAELEWKEAIRIALEDNLQHQVRLRLGLDPTLLPPPLHTPHTHTVLPSLEWYRRAPHVANPAATTTTPAENVLHCTSLEKDTSKRLHQRKTQPAAAAATRDDPGEQKRDEIQHKQPVDIFQYLSEKYGTPAEQLQYLATTGSYRTAESHNTTETGYNIRWPVEANIIHPTPQHVRNSAPQHESVNTSEAPPTPTPTATPTSTAPPTATPTSTAPPTHPTLRESVVYDASRDSSGEAQRETHCRDHGVLLFESRFESGNLHQATQIGPREYNLKLRTDLYSSRHVQWFYFKVDNMQSGVTYTFHITNFMKKHSLYNYGMQPLLYSEHDTATGRVGWRRVGHHIRYYCSQSPAPSDHYTLTWRMEFPNDGDTCYLAHCYPYPYSSLLHYLNSIQHNHKKQRYIRREVLCHSLAGNVCPILTITDFDSPPDALRSRGGVVFSARVHPGETNSSWMMQGVIDFLTSDASHAKSLRNNYVFKVVPMLNPDGVVVGNYRTSLAGVDLNRVYKKPVENLFPTIYHTKRMTAAFMQERELVLYIDLHGHSRKHNVFMYGCHVPQCDHTHFLNERVIPFLLSQQSPDKFCFQSCKFHVHKCKESTGRVVNWRMGVANSFTLEATFCGSTLEGPSRQFTEADLLAMGSDACEAIHKYHKFNQSKTFQQKILSQLAELIMKSIQSPVPRHNPTVPLPDIVTSSTPRVAGSTHHAQDEARMHKKHRTKHSSKILHRFMKCDMSLLEAESSTSGSDSENDEFQYRKHKTHHHGSKHKRHRRHRSLQVQTHTQLLQRHQPASTGANPPHKPSRPSLPTDEDLPPLKLHASAPARLQNTSLKKVPPAGYRFVNRYANRSNGGIPMFSEERLKERAEKERLRSLSMIQPISDQSRTLSPAAPPTHNPHNETYHNPLQSTLSHRALPLLWQPNTSQNQGSRSEYEAIRQRQIALSLRRKPTSRDTSLQHYQHIKGLVEKHKGARQVGGALHVPGHAHQPHPPPHEGLGRRQLPPQLARYISEIWGKNLN